jgi:hypothetical protein
MTFSGMIHNLHKTNVGIFMPHCLQEAIPLVILNCIQTVRPICDFRIFEVGLTQTTWNHAEISKWSSCIWFSNKMFLNLVTFSSMLHVWVNSPFLV